MYKIVEKRASASATSIEIDLGNDEYTFRDLMSNRDALLEHVNIQLGKGHRGTGMPVLGKDETVPAIDDLYECHPGRYVRKSSTAPHLEFVYLRGASVNATVKYMMNAGWYPYHCKAKDMPTNEEWDNFAWFLHLFHCVYCFFEGIARTNDLARLVLIYLCYGEYSWQTTKKKHVPGSLQKVLQKMCITIEDPREHPQR